MSESDDWMSVAKAADRVERSASTVYGWLELPETETHIRRRKVGRKTYVHLPTVLDYEATIVIGRPRKS